jgi:glycosyltransferase involved in cell wall biosynthesis
MNHVARQMPLASDFAAPLVADMSLALINRTGAYHVCREIAAGCGDLIDGLRYWRLRRSGQPENNFRRVLARLMLFEICHPGIGAWLPARRRMRESILYMDPLYVLGDAPGQNDIVLCHDLGPVTHPELFDPSTEDSYRRAYEAIQRGRPGMVFVSQASRDAFVALYGADYPFLSVIPLFVREFDRSGGGRPPMPGMKPFLLTVGALDRRKNHLRSMRAFVESGLAGEGYSYVFCGPRGNAAAEVLAAAAATPGVVPLAYVDDAELRWLYGNAAGFVLPSLLEGFGMPALEAAQHGLLSLVGRGGAQREAVGEGAVFVDETSVADIACGLRRLVGMDPAERAWRVEMACAHARDLSRERFLASWRMLLETRRPS